MKPILLKAGIPLALSLAGFIYTMVMTRRRSLPKVSPVETQCETNYGEEFRDQESFHSLDSTSLPSEEEEQPITGTQIMGLSQSSQIHDRPNLEEEILGLRSWVIALQDRERELEMRFLHYCDLKEQEAVLRELQNMLTLEIARAEFLSLEVEFIEAENQRIKAMVVEFLSVAEQLKSARLENRLLRRKVKKLLRTKKEHSRVLMQQTSVLQAGDAEIFRNHKELEQRAQVIKELEDEVTEQRRIVSQLQEEKKELVQKLELAETSVSSTSKV